MLNELSLIGEGAEVGVYRGDFSAHILKHWNGNLLYSIDSWMHQGNHLDVSDVEQKEHNANKRACIEKLKPFKKRSSIISEFSHRAADAFAKHEHAELDFVYLDAAHDYRSVMEDIKTWYPRIKVGGILAGHDYKNSFVRKNLVEVKRAVDNFAFETGLVVYVTTEDNLPSWYIFKK